MSSEAGHALPDRLAEILDIEEFVRTSWLKNVRHLPGKAFVSETELYGAVHAAAQRIKAGELDGAAVRFFRGREALDADSLDFFACLPRPEDTTMDAYAARLASHGVPHFMLVLNEAHHHSATLRDKTLRFFSGFTQHVGIPMKGIQYDIFFGVYDETPFGVHRDPQLESFVFMPRGRKRYHLWDAPTWESRVGGPFRATAPTFRDHLDVATNIDLRGGDAMYWPEQFWHIAETPELSIQFGVGYLTGMTAYDWVLEELIGALRELAVGEPAPRLVPCDLADPSAAARTLPPVLAHAKQLVARACENLDELATIAWARRLSAQGVYRNLSNGGPSVALGDADRLSHAAMLPLVRVPLNAEQIVCAAGGKRWLVPRHARMDRTLDMIATARQVAVEQLLEVGVIDDDQAQVSRDDLRRLLEEMVQFGVLVVDR